MAKFCNNCGKVVNEGSSFCDGCGNALNSVQMQKPRTKPKYFLISGISGGLSILLGIIAWMVFSSRPSGAADRAGNRAAYQTAETLLVVCIIALVVAITVLIIGVINKNKNRSVK